MDDRGKYIYISQEEMNAVAEYIKREGRVSISHLASKSNQFIDLEPISQFVDDISSVEEIAVAWYFHALYRCEEMVKSLHFVDSSLIYQSLFPLIRLFDVPYTVKEKENCLIIFFQVHFLNLRYLVEKEKLDTLFFFWGGG